MLLSVAKYLMNVSQLYVGMVYLRFSVRVPFCLCRFLSIWEKKNKIKLIVTSFYQDFGAVSFVQFS